MIRIKVKKARLAQAPADKCFWVRDGRILANLKDLETALQEMTEETFRYHVNKEKNDFSKWVEEVLQDRTLARELKRVRTRRGALKKVRASLKS